MRNHLNRFSWISVQLALAVAMVAALCSQGIAQSGSGRYRMAQADPSNDDDRRARLLNELRRIRGQPAESRPAPTEPFSPPLPVRRKTPNDDQPDRGGAETPAPAVAPPSDGEISALVSKIVLLGFSGTQSQDAGVKAVRSLLESSSIAGVVVGKDNIVSRTQTKDLLKSLTVGRMKPIVALNETGGTNTALTAEKGFIPWPSQKEIAGFGDPQYAYSTYQTLTANLEWLGFTLNFGPKLAATATSDSFSADPLKNAVFAKTFILAHRESNVVAVPIVEDGDAILRSLKTLLVSYPQTGVAAFKDSGKRLDILGSRLLSGPRFCMTSAKATTDADKIADEISAGCDVFVIDAGEQAMSFRQKFGASVNAAVTKGTLTLAQLTTAAARLDALRSKSGLTSGQ